MDSSNCTHALGTVKPGLEMQARQRIDSEDGLPCAEPALPGKTICRRHLELVRRVERINLGRYPDCDDSGQVCATCNAPLGLDPCAHAIGHHCRSYRHAIC